MQKAQSYKSVADWRECRGLWKAIELPLKICQTAAFLEVTLFTLYELKE